MHSAEPKSRKEILREITRGVDGEEYDPRHPHPVPRFRTSAAVGPSASSVASFLSCMPPLASGAVKQPVDSWDNLRTESAPFDTVPEPEPEPEPQLQQPSASSQARPAPKETLGADAVEIDLDGTGRSVHIKEDQSSNTGGVGGELWDGSVALALWLLQQLLPLTQPKAYGVETNVCFRSVLELGAGTGLVGLSAAVLCGATVVLSDRGDGLNVTRQNFRHNEQRHRLRGASVVELDWVAAAAAARTSCDASPSWATALLQKLPGAAAAGGGSSNQAKFDYVVGSEILYDGRLYADLATVLGCVTGENTVCALSYSVAPNSKMLARFFSLASEEGLVEVARLDGSTVEELCGEHGQRLYDQHCDGDPCDVTIVLLRRGKQRGEGGDV